MRAGEWELRRVIVAGLVVWAIPLGEPAEQSTAVLGWIRETSGGWQRYPADRNAPVCADPEDAVLDVLERRAYEEQPD